jgi:HPt (histidine-containing phosphotransfer) domain-containing protein
MSYSLEQIEAISNGDQDFIQSIVELFIDNASSCLLEMKKGVTSKDGAKVKFYAHQLKPSIDLFEIKDAKELVRILENESLNDCVDFAELASNLVEFSEIVNSVLLLLKNRFNIG